MEQVRIGLIGAGLIGATHSLMLQQIAAARPGRVELIAVADPDLESSRRLVEQYGYLRSFERGVDLFEQADVNAVFVCTPTRYHAELVQAAAAAGVHVFCEKPVGMSYEEGRSMLEAVRSAGVKAQTGLVLRFSAVYNVMRDLLGSSDAAEPMAVLFRDDQCFPIRGLHGTAWRRDRSLTAGGTLIEHGVHDLDLLTWLFGPMIRLRAWEQNRAGHPGVEDYMAVEIELRGGLRVQLVNVWHDMAQRPSNRRLEVFCRRAFMASNHDMLGEIELQRRDGPAETLPADEVLRRFRSLVGCANDALHDWYGLPYFVQDLAFVDALLDDRVPSPGLDAGVEAQRLGEAVYEAARTGEEIELENFVGRTE